MNRDANLRHNQFPVESTPELDRLLAAHFAPGEELAPSSGFSLSVMETVQAESSAPRPIGFPWRRVLPGMIAVASVMAVFCVLAIRVWRAAIVANNPMNHAIPADLHSPLAAVHLTQPEQALGWAALSTIVSLAAAFSSMRLARGRA